MLQRVIVFVPRLPDAARWWKETVEYCCARNYHVGAIVTRMEDLKKAALLHRATLVVVARRAHLLPDIPIEVVNEQGDPVDGPKRHRRPQRRTWVPPR